MAKLDGGWTVIKFYLAAGLILVWPAYGGAQTITQFSINAPGGQDGNAITAGPDGALWFLTGDIGRITTSGGWNLYTCNCAQNPANIGAGVGIAAGPDGALWFSDVGNSAIGRITTSGAITKYTASSLSTPGGITAGPDGAIWFTDDAGKIGRVTTSGTITEFPIPSVLYAPRGIVAGSDGALWFTEADTRIGRITTSGVLSEYLISVPSGSTAAEPNGIAAGPDGALWFTDLTGDRIWRITTSGAYGAFPIPTSGSGPAGIAVGPDGALWFTEFLAAKIGRITTSGTITEYPLPAGLSSPTGIAAGPDGAMWFTDLEGVGRITTPSGSTSTSPLVAAVLPSSRSVEVGNTATAFATIINSGSSAASGCAIEPVTSVPASFVYQTTNPATNALTGTPNTPVSIGGNSGSQTFVIALTPNAPVAPTEVALGFDCAGVNAASSTTGLNTLLYSASATPVPDIVALAATAQNDGILHITGTSGSNAFAVATVNVGAGAQITATANTGTATVPLSINLCQTDPTSGQCISSVGPTATFNINANATPTVAIFATASGSVSFIPQTNRIFVEFSDASGTVRGSTSVAVQTQ